MFLLDTIVQIWLFKTLSKMLILPMNHLYLISRKWNEQLEHSLYKELCIDYTYLTHT